MNKKAQFYLIAAVVIVGVLLTFTAVGNSARKDYLDKTRIYNLFNELNLGDEKILDYDELIQIREDHLPSRLAEFTNLYEVYLRQNKIIYFVVGNSVGEKAFSFEKSDGNFQIESYENGGETISLNIEGKRYNFDKKEERYYYIVFVEDNGEQYVVSG